MKLNSTQFTKKPIRSATLAALLFSVVGFSSCTNNDDYVVPDQVVFSITNASPGRPMVDFLIDNKKVAKASPLSLGDNTGYYLTTPGLRTATIKNAGADASLTEQPINLIKDRIHSIYVVDSTAELTTFINVIDQFQVKSEGTTGNAQIRFLNLSPGSPELDLVYDGDTTAFDRRAYKNYTGFKFVKAKKGILLSLRNTQTKEIVATLPDIELKNEEIYSIWAKGPFSTTSADTTQKFSIKITRHTNATK